MMDETSTANFESNTYEFNFQKMYRDLSGNYHFWAYDLFVATYNQAEL